MSRICGSCRACCTVLGVPEIKKPADTACEHLCAQGCSVYPSRPASCKAFECLWLQDRTGAFNHMDRPNECGLIFSIQYGTAFGDILTAYEIHPGSSHGTRALRLLKTLSRKTLLMVVSESGRRILGPPRETAQAAKIVERAKRVQSEAQLAPRIVMEPSKETGHA